MTVPPPGTGQLPSTLVLGTVALGLLLAAGVDWQLGSRVVGLSFLLGAGLRLSLPGEAAGWLAVRTRALDGAVLAVLGVVVLALAQTIPRD